MNPSKMHGLALILLITATVFLVCCFTPSSRVTQWLEYERKGPLLDIPHVYVSGVYKETIRIRANGQWKTASSISRKSSFWEMRPRKLDNGRSVLVNLPDGAKIFSEGVAEAAAIPTSDCQEIHPSIKTNEVVCFAADDLNGDSRISDRKIVHIRLDSYDLQGKIVSTALYGVPATLSGAFPYKAQFIGWSTKRVPLMEGRFLSSDVCIAIALKDGEARELKRVKRNFGCPRGAEWARYGVFLHDE